MKMNTVKPPAITRLADPRFDLLGEFRKYRLTMACSWLCELSTVVLEVDASFSFRQNHGYCDKVLTE